MDTLQSIETRRSVRRYTAQKPSAGQVLRVLDAARRAPSGLNNQPWRFRIVDQAAELEGLAGFTRYGAIIRNAPAAIAVCFSTSTSYHREKDLMAIGACVQNLLLAAHALGLGACWLGEILNRRDEAAAFLELPADCELVALVTLGVPARKLARGRRRPLDELLLAAPGRGGALPPG